MSMVQLVKSCSDGPVQDSAISTPSPELPGGLIVFWSGRRTCDQHVASPCAAGLVLGWVTVRLRARKPSPHSENFHVMLTMALPDNGQRITLYSNKLKVRSAISATAGIFCSCVERVKRSVVVLLPIKC